jgi:peptidoglycan LD-endopeptidase LytH
MNKLKNHVILVIRRMMVVLVIIALVFGMYGAWRLYRRYIRPADSSGSNGSNSNIDIARWRENPDLRPEMNTPGGAACPGAPFILPTSGFIGLLWNDPALPYSEDARHTGIDIFGDGEAGTVPVYAVYDGWLTRQEDWKSTVVVRHDDPLQPGRRIWTWYTHMASRDGTKDFILDIYAPGTYGMPVKQGTILGYQGEYAGTGMAILMHTHLSIIKSDSSGAFLNEAVQANTLDPSPYFGLELDYEGNPVKPIRCKSQ